MRRDKQPAKVIDLDEWRRKRLGLQDRGGCELCVRCEPICGEVEASRLADLQRELTLRVLDPGRPSEAEPESSGDEAPEKK